eukprot:TRINITY_DN974_c0_g1_i1.p2 TRINITY_DN974_c0_g1~~TRINITY_DN974_c0_g1_i1.p2  ORF type:complete len:381 (-),score=70.37 TRINITY_DN974_c0_g1_i1:715-1857(-)
MVPASRLVAFLAALPVLMAASDLVLIQRHAEMREHPHHARAPHRQLARNSHQRLKSKRPAGSSASLEIPKESDHPRDVKRRYLGQQLHENLHRQRAFPHHRDPAIHQRKKRARQEARRRARAHHAGKDAAALEAATMLVKQNQTQSVASNASESENPFGIVIHAAKAKIADIIGSGEDEETEIVEEESENSTSATSNSSSVGDVVENKTLVKANVSVVGTFSTSNISQTDVAKANVSAVGTPSEVRVNASLNVSTSNATGATSSATQRRKTFSQPVSFRVLAAHATEGDEVLLVGQGWQLGDWDPKQGLKMRTDDASFPEWHLDNVQLMFEGDFVEYKYVVRRKDGEIEWEPFLINRKVYPTPAPAFLRVLACTFGVYSV